MMSLIRKPVASLAVGLAAVVLASAAFAIPMVSGDIDAITAPPSVQPGALIDDLRMKFFFEKELTLGSLLSVDAQGTGTYVDAPDLNGGTIAAGTKIDTFFFHGDVHAQNFGAFFAGSVLFDQDILGVILLSRTLRATDAQLGHVGTLYPVSGGGFELDGASDGFEIAVDNRTLLVTMSVSDLDQLRVITRAPQGQVPLPGTLLLMIPALLGLGWNRRAVAAKQIA